MAYVERMTTKNQTQAVSVQDGCEKLYKLSASSLRRYVAYVYAKNEEDAYDVARIEDAWEDLMDQADWEYDNAEIVSEKGE